MAKMYLIVDGAANNQPQLVRELKQDDDRSVERYICDLFAEVPRDTTELDALVAMYAWHVGDMTTCSIGVARTGINYAEDYDCTSFMLGTLLEGRIHARLGTLGVSSIQKLVDEEADIYITTRQGPSPRVSALDDEITKNGYEYAMFNGQFSEVKTEQYKAWQTERLERYYRAGMPN